ncbi:hypothetical protein [Planomicrobium sp. YIM 101495]|uniref:rolling circle replication-associated protein n=1 Tax=Planomicrobium sp. YIM 101495 TaxID=2665160 RepID=UPI0012B825F7|nr:hypothetical protein [Planomicrobium sp. YIM 101495]MTD32270.1 hypothetical protein [Planomicrobium sp. YIM 101495]
MNLNDENEYVIKEGDYVTVTKMGHVVEVQHMLKKNTTNHTLKLDADRYMVIETGEILEYEKSNTRADNMNSLRKTFKKLRYLINNNFVGGRNELFLTLTFAQESFDNGMVTTATKNFMKRLKYRYKDESTIDYLSVVEPHASGQWHLHVLLRFNELDRVFIPSNELASIWGQGFVQVKSLVDIDNIGAYLSAYLADHPVPDDFQPRSDQTQVIVKQVDGKEKKFIKGGRLDWYPPGMNLYRKSKGIVFPEREEMEYKKAKKIVGSVKPHFKKSYHVEKDDFKNTITYEQYNLKRQQNNS